MRARLSRRWALEEREDVARPLLLLGRLRRGWVEINYQGFTVSTVIGERFYPWTTVGPFRLKTLFGTTFVLIDVVVPNQTATAKRWAELRAPGLHPKAYGMSRRQLLELMNTCRQQALGL